MMQNDIQFFWIPDRPEPGLWASMALLSSSIKDGTKGAASEKKMRLSPIALFLKAHFFVILIAMSRKKNLIIKLYESTLLIKFFYVQDKKLLAPPLAFKNLAESSIIFINSLTRSIYSSILK